MDLVAGARFGAGVECGCQRNHGMGHDAVRRLRRKFTGTKINKIYKNSLLNFIFRKIIK